MRQIQTLVAMLTKEIKYRLGEFIIIEHGDILFTWVMHIALGAQRSGKCFIIGNILVLVHWDHEESGFLKLEFHEQLMKLPAWNKTRYYCFASSLRKVVTARSLTSDNVEQLSVEKKYNKTDHIIEPGIFRLRRYKITVDEKGHISWQTIIELNRTLCGKSFVESGILFLEPKEDELYEDQSKQQFFKRLKLLPRWDKTSAWGYSGVLKICNESELRKSYAAVRTPEYMETCLTKNKSFSQSKEFRKKRLFELKASGVQWSRMAWQSIVGWKVWGRLTSLIIACIYFGVRIVMFVAKIIAFLLHRIIQRFHEYRDK